MNGVDDVDVILNQVLKEIGVDPSKPAHWMENIDKTFDQTTGKLVKKYERGYLCSYCGKHSWTKKEKCDGCNSIMQMG